MLYFIIGAVIIIAIAVGAVLVYRNNQKQADALIAKGQDVATKVENAVK